MLCIHCGHTLPPDASFCPGCGQKVETPSDTTCADASGQAVPVDCVPDEIESNMNYALIITILALFHCGAFINLVLGIIAVIFASKAEQDLRSGDRESATGNAATAKSLCMIATIVIILQMLAVFIFVGLWLFCAMLPIILA